MAKSPALGIHFGVKHSSMATYRHGTVEIIPTDDGNLILENYIAFTNNMLYVGCAAKCQEINNPENTVYDAKRMIGRSFDDLNALSELRGWPFRFVKSGDKPKVVVRYKGAPATFFPEELVAMVLIKMMLEAERHLGVEATEAVIALPAYFSDTQREAIRQAAIVAGLNVIHFIAEPLAAAIAYDLDSQNKGKRNILVFDFGGGTLVVSVLTTVNGGGLEVKSSSGDICLGGEYIDSILMKYFVEEFNRKFNRDLTANKWAMQRLRSACENAKHRLSYSKLANIEIDSLLDNIDFYTYLSRAKFEELTENFFMVTLEHIDIALREASINSFQITDVVLVGGSTRIPRVKELLLKKFSGREMYTSLTPELIMSYGAAVLASTLNGENKKMEERFTLNTIPLSLGIETNGGVMSIVVPRNSPIPTKRTKVFTTSLDNQVGVAIRVFEGERTIAKNNYLLGNLCLNSIQPTRHGLPKIEVIFEIDVNGVLSVTALEKLNASSKRSTIAQCKGRSMTSEEIGRVVKEANNFFRLDETRRINALAKGRLVAYCTSMMTVAKEASMVRKLPELSRVDQVMKVCSEMIVWANGNSNADKEQFETKLENAKSVCAPIVSLISETCAKRPEISMGLPTEEFNVSDIEGGDADRESVGFAECDVERVQQPLKLQ